MSCLTLKRLVYYRVTANDFRFANVRRAILMCAQCSCVGSFSAFEFYRAASVAWFNGSYELHPTFETIEIVVVSKSELCSVCVWHAWHVYRASVCVAYCTIARQLKPPPG